LPEQHGLTAQVHGTISVPGDLAGATRDPDVPRAAVRPRVGLCDHGRADARPARASLAHAAFVDPHAQAPRAFTHNELDVLTVRAVGLNRGRTREVQRVQLSNGRD